MASFENVPAPRRQSAITESSLATFKTILSQTEEQDFAAGDLEPIVLKSLEDHADRLAELSQSIWENPELSFQETHAVKLLTDYLEKEGYKVTRPYGGLETSFLGEFQTKGYDRNLGHPTVAVMCEYDALPEIGHACGHNLIAEAGLGTFIAVCQALKANEGIEGKVLCMGSPAEEGGAGKVVLIKAGAFKDVDFAMMVHPAPIDILELAILGVDQCQVDFYGKESHASVHPWDGINALDAAMAAYNNVSMLRQQLPVAHQIQMIIVHGGDSSNVIPKHTTSTYAVRAPSLAGMELLRRKLIACLEAAALATECRLEYKFDEHPYGPLLLNKTMLSVYHHYGRKHGMFFPVIRPSYGSTDMGDVSTVVPSIHPAFAAGGLTMIHTEEFAVLAGKPGAHKLARRAAMAMAMTTLELMVSAKFRRTVREEFDSSLPTFTGASGAESGGTF
ncbi:Peptidase M20 domain-containing protein 2 [Hypsibius exemplaris]|uniref:Peptidase M20 domain-containing protein 2 n=1 Tax=Hypsibius exemplaris TaxID=2072580 RepID=A0A1W0X1S8_HYPEX|nr:Peptidase M20 domain-containing protein 2 [Hypsibius exemplaris]